MRFLDTNLRFVSKNLIVFFLIFFLRRLIIRRGGRSGRAHKTNLNRDFNQSVNLNFLKPGPRRPPRHC